MYGCMVKLIFFSPVVRCYRLHDVERKMMFKNKCKIRDGLLKIVMRSKQECDNFVFIGFFFIVISIIDLYMLSLNFHLDILSSPQY